MEYSVFVSDVWGAGHVKPFSGRVIGVDSISEAAEKWVSRFFDRSLKVDSVAVCPSNCSANATLAVVKCEGGQTFFLYVF